MRPTPPTALYRGLDWEIVDDVLVATVQGPFGAWADLDLQVAIDPALQTQLDEDDPVGALDLLLPAQRTTLTLLVEHWADLAREVAPVLERHAATPLRVIVRDDDEPAVFGVAATTSSDEEHGLGIRLRGLAVIETGGMHLVL